MKVVNHQEAAAQQVLPQARCFAIVEVPVADLHRVNPRIIKNIIVARGENVSLARSLDPGQAADTTNKVVLSIRPVSLPRLLPAPATSGIAIGGLRETNKLKLARRFTNHARRRILAALVSLTPGNRCQQRACDGQQGEAFRQFCCHVALSAYRVARTYITDRRGIA
jgi:hypothetical protein